MQINQVSDDKRNLLFELEKIKKKLEEKIGFSSTQQ